MSIELGMQFFRRVTGQSEDAQTMVHRNGSTGAGVVLRRDFRDGVDGGFVLEWCLHCDPVPGKHAIIVGWDDDAMSYLSAIAYRSLVLRFHIGKMGIMRIGTAVDLGKTITVDRHAIPRIHSFGNE